MILLNIILLNYATMFFDFLQKSSEICVRFPFCLIACFGVGINISEEQYLWPFLELMACNRFLCFVHNNYSSCFGRNASKDPNFDFSRLCHLIVGVYAAGL